MGKVVVMQKKLIVKEHFYYNFESVLEYTVITFGSVVAKKFKNKALSAIKKLPKQYAIYPKNRFLLSTDEKTYRNIILNSYYIVFSVTSNSIIVLDIIYQGRNPDTIVKIIENTENKN